MRRAGRKGRNPFACLVNLQSTPSPGGPYCGPASDLEPHNDGCLDGYVQRRMGANSYQRNFTCQRVKVDIDLSGIMTICRCSRPSSLSSSRFPNPMPVEFQDPSCLPSLAPESNTCTSIACF